MELKNIEIENFRSIKKDFISFDQHSCLALIGRNEAGKSNLLKAIFTMSPLYDLQKQAASDKRFMPLNDSDSGISRVIFTFDFLDGDKKAILSDFAKIFTKAHFIDENFIRKISNPEEKISLSSLLTEKRIIKLIVDLNSKRKYWEFNSLSLENYDLTEVFIKPSLKTPFKSVVFNGNPLSDIKYISEDHYKEIQAHCLPTQFKPNSKKLLNEEFQKIMFNHTPNLIFWNNLDSHLFKFEVDLPVFLENPNTNMLFKNLCLLDRKNFKDESTIANILKDSRTNHKFPSLLKTISISATNYLKNMWTEFKEEKIVLHETGNKLIIMIEMEDGTPFELSYRSDGFKKFFKLLMDVSLADKTGNPIILMDEAEIFLHPSAAECFRDELIKLSKEHGIKIIFSTHSPFMVDPNEDNISRHLLVEKIGETTTSAHAKIGEGFKESLICQAMGCGIFRAVDRKTIIFEGWTDRTLFKKGLELLAEEDRKFLKIGSENNTSIAHAGGVTQIRNLVPLFTSAGSHPIVILDSDPAGDIEKKYLLEGHLINLNSVFTYNDINGLGVQMAEDFIQPIIIENHVNKILKNYSLSYNFSLVPNQIVCYCIKEFLKNNSIPDNTIDLIIKDFKESLFRDLKKEYILDKYSDFLIQFIEKIKIINKALRLTC